MVFLHKSMFQSHGYLSSANCHVDSRWVLKVSGFALHAFRKEKQADEVDTDCCNFAVLYLMMTADRPGPIHRLHPRHREE